MPVSIVLRVGDLRLGAQQWTSERIATGDDARKGSYAVCTRTDAVDAGAIPDAGGSHRTVISRLFGSLPLTH